MKLKIDCLEYLKTNGFNFKLSGEQANLKTCPFCNNINHKGNIHDNRFYINTTNGLFNCFNCNSSGDFVSFISQVEGIPRYEVLNKNSNKYIKDVLEYLIQDQPKGSETINTMPQLDLPKGFVSFCDKYTPEADKYLEYVQNRGFDYVEIAQGMNLMYSDNSWIDFGTKKILVRDRLIFPIHWEGKFVGWQGRDITGTQEPKYLISPGFKKTQMIYNYDRVYNSSEITIVEGLVDLIKCWDISPICLFGKTISTEQLKLMLNMPKLEKVYLAIDRDEEASYMKKGRLEKGATIKLAEILSNFWEVYIIRTIEKDPGDCTREQMVEYKKQAKRFNLNSLDTSLLT